jgi:sec-independent protein translocase protein TatC
MPLDQIDVDTLGSPSKKEMSFLDHLEALRWHLARSVIAVIVGAIVVFTAKDFVFNKIIFAPRFPDFFTYRFICSLSELLCFEPTPFKIITRDLAEKFLVHFKSSIALGFIIAFPYVFWEVWRFVKPALYERELKTARGIVFVCTLLFVTGVLFGYYIIAPFSISFLAGYQLGDIDATPTLASYMNYMIMFTLPVGLVFELPVVVYFFSRLGLIGPESMRSKRRLAFVVILIISALITPTTDAITLLIVTFPLYGLYEISILVSAKAQKQFEKAQNT